jgi:hypothetical protein
MEAIAILVTLGIIRLMIKTPKWLQEAGRSANQAIER